MENKMASTLFDMTIFGIPTWTFPSSTVLPYGALSVAKSANYKAIQRDPGGLAQGFVDLDLGCSTILLGQ